MTGATLPENTNAYLWGAAIGAIACSCGCSVLTDDLALYLRLSSDNVNVINFTHLRAADYR